MKEIKELTLKHLDDCLELTYKTYPSFKDYSDEGKKEIRALLKVRFEDTTSKYFGMFIDDKLIASMRIFIFDLNFYNKIINASGLASLAVDLLYKKQGIAREMCDFYEKFTLDNNILIASLLPFRFDFYYKLGYGYGGKMNRYHLSCKDFPAYYDESDLRYLSNEQSNQLLPIYNKVHSKTHGMFNRIVDESYDYQYNKNLNFVACYENDIMSGYLIYEFVNGKEDNFTINDMLVKEIIYQDSTTLKKLLGFIRKQDDQIRYVRIDTQDLYFANLFINPISNTQNYIPFGNLETNTQAIGPMFKILNVEKAFINHSRKYNNLNLNIKFIITSEKDNFEEIILSFKDGIPSLEINNDYDVIVEMSIQNFSSLYMGCLNFSNLNRLGLLKIDKPEYLNELDLGFYYPHQPITHTDF